MLKILTALRKTREYRKQRRLIQAGTNSAATSLQPRQAIGYIIVIFIILRVNTVSRLLKAEYRAWIRLESGRTARERVW
jgi:hypothetical protein